MTQRAQLNDFDEIRPGDRFTIGGSTYHVLDVDVMGEMNVDGSREYTAGVRARGQFGSEHTVSYQRIARYVDSLSRKAGELTDEQIAEIRQ